jgi:dienelactone hydrolase
MKFMATLLLIVCTSVSAGNITLKTPDGFTLHGSYFAGNKAGPGVLMLHQCNADRTMYDQLGKKLAAQGIHALSLDFRMYGDSVTESINLANIRSTANSSQEARKKVANIRLKWPNDVLLAEQFLRAKMGNKATLGVVGASCGGGQAIILAGSKTVNALMFFSSGLSQDRLDAFEMLDSTPTYIIAAQEDKYTFNSANKLFAMTTNLQNKLVSYKGKGHGSPLFKHDLGLADSMVTWFAQQLH